MAEKIDKFKKNSLIFIDTNILLDFYRFGQSEAALTYLEKIEEYKDILILSSQVEMEFKKNRQDVIFGKYKELKEKLSGNASLPIPFSDTEIKKNNEIIVKQKELIEKKVFNLIKNPEDNDKVFKIINKLFNVKNDFNLDRGNNQRHSIRTLAEKRFKLGYPPRKKEDISFGDAINWEWIINCAQRTEKNIIIITRDSDFGIKFKDDFILDDWLNLEFKERTNSKKLIYLTDKLTEGFQYAGIPISKTTMQAMNKEEEKIQIKEEPKKAVNAYLELSKLIKDAIKIDDTYSYMTSLLDKYEKKSKK